MARFYPPELSVKTLSGGEISIFNKIKESGQDYDWSVMHSYHVSNHVFKKWSEIDFLIVIPNKGVVCVEVKDHEQIEFNGREWFFGRRRKKGESPFKQIKDNEQSLSKAIRKQDPKLNVPWWSAVIFTRAKFDGKSLPTEINDWEFMDADAYSRSTNALFDFINNVIKEGRKKLSKRKDSNWVTSKDNDSGVYRTLVDTLSGKGLFSISKQARSGDRETSLGLATDEQFQILDLLAQTPRLFVEGLAGTGKTLMAAKIAERESFKKRKVLFLAYNVNLVNELRFWPSLESENITIDSIDRFFTNRVSDKTRIKEEDYWDKTLPIQFFAEIKNLGLTDYFDVLVIDEAQDIFSKPYKISAINRILKNGLSEGKWSIFGDFNEQMIYGNESKQDILSNLAKYCVEKRYITWSLGKNSRNPIDIGSYAQEYGRINKKYEAFLRHDHGKKEYKIYNQENRLKKIEQVLDSLKRDKYEPHEIVLLSRKKIEKPLIKYIRDLNYNIKDFKDKDAGNDYLRYSTISSFKGLESPVIVLLDIDKFDRDFESLFYIGITRTTERLIMLVTEEAITDIENV